MLTFSNLLTGKSGEFEKQRKHESFLWKKKKSLWIELIWFWKVGRENMLSLQMLDNFFKEDRNTFKEDVVKRLGSEITKKP